MKGGLMLIYYYILTLIALFVDQRIKWAVVHDMELGQSIPIIKNVFHLTSSRNRGAAFGILQNQRLFFIIITCIVVIGIIYYLHKIYKEKRLLAIALSLIMGGALGNFVDRAFKGEVVDMLDFNLIDYPIFNAADSFISIGATIIILINVMEAWQEHRKNSLM